MHGVNASRRASRWSTTTAPSCTFPRRPTTRASWRRSKPFVADDCVVGIDAPLIVTNPTGNRPCEAALNRDFRGFEAGAHPSNTGKPEFANGTRGARLAAALDLDLDPHSPRPRRALEVYPHAAAVALFRLGRTLKYKAQAGTQIRAAAVGTAPADEPHRGTAGCRMSPLRVAQHEDWQRLRHSVETATRKSELRRAEDPVDAVLCAYVALFSVRRPDDVTVYGDARHRLHPHADTAARADSATAGTDSGRAPDSHRRLRGPPARPGRRHRELPRVGDGASGRRRHQLPQHHGAHQERRVVRGQGRADRGRSATLQRPAGRDHRPGRAADHHVSARGRRRGRDAARRRDAAARRPRHGAGDCARGPLGVRQQAPAGRRREANSSPRRSRCAPCCSTHGRSSSTTSATRVRFPPSTRRTWIDGSRWRPGCSNSPIASSPPSASGCGSP